MTKEEMAKGVIPIGEHCDAQGDYYTCMVMKEEGVGGMCPYLKDGINHQNECPHNQLKDK